MPNLNTNEYTFSSVRIRALESDLVGRDRIEQLLEIQSGEQLLSALSGFGFAVPEDERITDKIPSSVFEPMLQETLRKAYATVAEDLPDATVLNLMRYRYDCHNVKSALKCAVRNLPAGDLMIPLGSVPLSEYPEMLRKHDYSLLPAHMAAGAAEAETAYAATSNPQSIDLILDKACYLDLSDVCKTLGSGILTDYVQSRADLTNAVMTLRVIRMGDTPSSAALLDSALLPLGKMNRSFFTDARAEGEEVFLEKFSYSPYYRVGRAFAEGEQTLSEFERLCDDELMDRLRGIRFIHYKLLYTVQRYKKFGELSNFIVSLQHDCHCTHRKRPHDEVWRTPTKRTCRIIGQPHRLRTTVPQYRSTSWFGRLFSYLVALGLQ